MKPMYINLGQQINTTDLAKALQTERGIFEAVSPSGEKYRVEVESDEDGSLSSSGITGFVQVGRGNQPWQVTKIAELPAQQRQQQNQQTQREQSQQQQRSRATTA
jgi:hypothetical protein